jgi:hypothetical protein
LGVVNATDSPPCGSDSSSMVLITSTKGSLGEGSLQFFIEAEFEQHWFTLREDPRHRERLQEICVYDFVANNADRKSGHRFPWPLV